MHMEKTLVTMFRTSFVNIFVLCVLFLVPLQAQERQATTRANECIDIFNDVLRQVDVNYVDTLNYEALTETAIHAMLRKIDPYTIYYPKKKDDDLRMMTQGKYANHRLSSSDNRSCRGRSCAAWHG